MNCKSVVVAMVVFACAFAGRSGGAVAAEPSDMIGKWKWTDYTIEVAECTTNPSGAGICATVIEGPQNKGMEMIRSKLTKKDDDILATVAHPATSELYSTVLTFSAPDTWHLDGCTDAGVCAKGDFVRVK